MTSQHQKIKQEMARMAKTNASAMDTLDDVEAHSFAKAGYEVRQVHNTVSSPTLSNHESIGESTATESVEDLAENSERGPRGVAKRRRIIKKQRSNENRKRERYQTVSNNTRLELVQMVEHQGFSLKDAASELQINYSTAKSIFAMYKKEGRILKKVNRRRFEVSPTELAQIQNQFGQSKPENMANHTSVPNMTSQVGSYSSGYPTSNSASNATVSTTDAYQSLMGHQYPKDFAPRMCCPNCTAPLTLKKTTLDNGTEKFVLETDGTHFNQGATMNAQIQLKNQQQMLENRPVVMMQGNRFFQRGEESRQDPSDTYLNQEDGDAVYMGEEPKQFENDFGSNAFAGHFI